MARYWTIDSRKRTVDVMADGAVSMADATAEQAQRIARLLGAAAVADRPMKVFEDVKPARRWLEAQPSRHP